MGTEHEANTIEPVTPQAIAAIFDAEKLDYRIDPAGDEAAGDLVRSGFINAAIVLGVDGSNLVFEALWRGSPPTSLASDVLFAVNEYNQLQFAPTLRMFETEGQTIAVSAIRSLEVSEGASFNQLGAFIVHSIEATMHAFAFLEASLPTLVIWKDPHDEH